MTDTTIRIGDLPVEIRYDGSRRIGDREVTSGAASAASTSGALRYSPAWRRLALAFCADRDVAIEDRPREGIFAAVPEARVVAPSTPAADFPKSAAGQRPGRSSIPPEERPGATETCSGREGVGAQGAVGVGASTEGAEVSA